MANSLFKVWYIIIMYLFYVDRRLHLEDQDLVPDQDRERDRSRPRDTDPTFHWIAQVCGYYLMISI